MDSQTWRRSAACKDIPVSSDGDIFFLNRGGSPIKATSTYCSHCPVVRECRDFAILYGERGIWGGMTDEQRDLIAPYLAESLRANAVNQGTLEDRTPLNWSSRRPATLNQAAQALDSLLESQLDNASDYFVDFGLGGLELESETENLASFEVPVEPLPLIAVVLAMLKAS